MSKLNTFQRNNLITGTNLAAEIQSSSPERRAFVVVGAYVQTSLGRFAKPSKFLNKDLDNLRFWIRKYEVNECDIDKYIADENLFNAIYVDDIQTMDQLENALEQYIQDFSHLEVPWKVDNPL